MGKPSRDKEELLLQGGFIVKDKDDSVSVSLKDFCCGNLSMRLPQHARTWVRKSALCPMRNPKKLEKSLFVEKLQ